MVRHLPRADLLKPVCPAQVVLRSTRRLYIPKTSIVLPILSNPGRSRPFRSGSPVSADELTVTDNVTDLMWQRCSAGLGGTNCSVGSAETRTWVGAILYCEGLSPDGILTTLTIDANGHLTDIIYPDSTNYAFEYGTDGLMTAEEDPNLNRFEPKMLDKHPTGG